MTQPIGAESIPPPKNLHSLQAIMKLKPTTTNNNYCTFAFALNRDMIKPDGTLDELHAVVFPLASFKDQDMAHNYALDVIQRTGHSGVIAAKFGSPVQLTSKFDPDNVIEVLVDDKGMIKDIESEQYKRDRDAYEKQIEYEKELQQEAEAECDPDHIEHFKRSAYLAIKNLSALKHNLKQVRENKENYIKRRDQLREHYNLHPEHEENWLPYLKEKLTERGELSLYQSLEYGYNQIREELLGIKDDTYLMEE